MATDSSVLAWRIPGTAEPGGLPSMGSHWVRHNWSNLAAAAAETFLGFPCSSDGEESSCSAGDPGSISGSESSPGEGIGYPLQYSWTSLVAQMVKNMPVMQETWVKSLGWVGKIPWRRAWYPTLVFLPRESPRTEEPGGLQSLGLQRVKTLSS